MAPRPQTASAHAFLKSGGFLEVWNCNLVPGLIIRQSLGNVVMVIHPENVACHARAVPPAVPGFQKAVLGAAGAQSSNFSLRPLARAAARRQPRNRTPRQCRGATLCSSL